VAYRSWLKDVKTVYDLGPQSSLVDWTQDNAIKKQEHYDGKRLDLARVPLPIATEDQRYFGSRMHDSPVVSIIRRSHSVEISLNSDHANEFAGALARILERPDPIGPFEVRLTFHDVSYFNAARHQPDGSFRWCDWRSLPVSPTYSLDLSTITLLNDVFHQEAGRLQWVCTLWAHPRGRRPVESPSVYLMVDCAAVSTLDLCRVAIGREFGEDWAMVWGRLAERNSSRPMTEWLWGPELEAFLLEERVHMGPF
jgi:hypothetical protein